MGVPPRSGPAATVFPSAPGRPAAFRTDRHHDGRIILSRPQTLRPGVPPGFPAPYSPAPCPLSRRGTNGDSL